MGKKNFKKSKPQEKEQKEFDEEVLQIDRVTRVVKGGRRLRFRCLVAIGDRKGRVGIGVGKATEVVNGIKKAVTKAKSDLIKVSITNTDSIPHEVKIKHKAARLFIMPAIPGTGVIAGGSLRKILSLAGIKNVLSKNHGTNNKVVTAQAAIMALKKLRPARKAKKIEDKPDKKEDVAKEKSEIRNPKNESFSAKIKAAAEKKDEKLNKPDTKDKAKESAKPKKKSEKTTKKTVKK
jgi:small subunit ribosomal protein S5